MTMKVIATDQYGITYADPSKPEFQIRLKTVQAQKSVDGVSLRNYVSEVIITDNSPVGSECTANEALSVRIRTSGSIQNKARLMALVNVLGLNLTSFVNGEVFFGFQPDTPPITE